MKQIIKKEMEIKAFIFDKETQQHENIFDEHAYVIGRKLYFIKNYEGYYAIDSIEMTVGNITIYLNGWVQTK